VTLLRQAAAFAGKDLRIEIRGRHALASVLPFAATFLLAFGLALGPGRAFLQRTAPALLWLAVLFSAVLASRQAYQIEVQDGALEGVVLSPVDRAAIFLGKTVAMVVGLLALELVVVLLVVLFFDVSLGNAPLVVGAALVLGTVGLTGVGSLFGIMATAPRAREAVLPLLVLPLATPVLLAGIRATDLAASGGGGEAGSWLGLLLAFDAVILALGTLVFGFLVED
jgi:heme exporter protein CcmB